MEQSEAWEQALPVARKTPQYPDDLQSGAPAPQGKDAADPLLPLHATHEPTVAPVVLHTGNAPPQSALLAQGVVQALVTPPTAQACWEVVQFVTLPSSQGLQRLFTGSQRGSPGTLLQSLSVVQHA